MQKNKVLKQLLAVSAFAAMFGAFQAHAQTNNARNEQATSATGTSGQGSTASGTSGQGSTASGTSAPQGSTGSGASPAQSSSPVGATGASDAQGSMATGGQTGAQGSSAAGQTTTDKTSTGASGSSGQDMSGQTSSGAGAAGQAGAGAKLSKADQRAVMDMARANMAEIEAAKLALSKSQDDQVKSYAQQMIDDHTMALTEVQTLAQARGVTLPTEPDSKHKAMAAKMEKLSGDAFNREYMRQAGVADHKRVLSMLQKEQKSAKDPDVKALAAKMLPTVEQHLKAAQAVPVAKSGTTSGK